MDFGYPAGVDFESFLILLVIWSVQKFICIAGMFFGDFEWEMISFLMSQPLKNILNTMVFIRLHFFNFFSNLMFSGITLDNIWRLWGVLNDHFHDLGGIEECLEFQ